ncbi:MAG: DEAD/DEAH box helicase family protein, partial [Gammaproteobacteria bacterium]
MNKVVSIISPEISSEIESVEDRKLRINSEIEDLTPRQKEAIFSAENNRRLLIDGLAGTGKTIIATELAGQSHNAGEKTCYICYNRGLANFIEEKYKDSGFDVFNLDKLLLKLSTFTYPP